MVCEDDKLDCTGYINSDKVVIASCSCVILLVRSVAFVDKFQCQLYPLWITVVLVLE